MSSDPTPYRRLLVLLADRLGEVPHTRLQKLVYLIDLEFFLRHGRTLTGAPWVRHKYGPMTKAFLPAMRDMDGYELVERHKPTLAGRTVKLVEPGPSPRFTADFTRDALATIEFMMAITQGLGDDQVRELAYATTPMQLIRAREAVLGHELIDEPIDFERMTGVGTPTKEHSDPGAYSAFKRAQREELGDLRERLLSDVG
jgi:Protein of unknown function (DUF4065)